MKASENNGKNSSGNIAKLKLQQKIISLLDFQLVYIRVEETDF